MRMAKTDRNSTTTKTNTTLPENNSTENTQTPIEIALKIDENGMTSLRSLYEFLQLSPSQFTRWCKRNVLQNPFATENIDYFTLRLDVDSSVKGQSKAEYMITSDFAKQLSMTVKNERGQEARKYFIACEQGLKVATHKLQSNSNNETNKKLIELLTSMDNRLSKLEEQSNKKQLLERKYSRWKTNTFSKLNTLLFYVNENSDDDLSLPNIIHLVIEETEDIYSIEINEYANLYRCEFGINSNVKVQVLDVINHYKDVKDMFTLTLDSIMEKLHISEDVNCNRPRNIFDELAAKVNENLEEK